MRPRPDQRALKSALSTRDLASAQLDALVCGPICAVPSRPSPQAAGAQQ